MYTIIVSLLAIGASSAALPEADEWQTRMNAGYQAELAGDFATAARAYRAAGEIVVGSPSRDQRRAVAWNALGMMYDALGQFAHAESEYRRALAAAEKSGGKTSETHAIVQGNLGSLYGEMGQTARGEKLLREALAYYLDGPSPDEARLAIMKNCLAELLLIARKYTEAGSLLREALPVLVKHTEHAYELGMVWNNLGVVHLYQKDYAESERLLLAALATMQKALGPDHPLQLRALGNLATLADRLGNRELAEARLKQALELAERRLGRDHPVYGALLSNYAAHVREGGDKSRAKALQAQAVRILKDSGRRNGIGAVIDVNALSQDKGR